MLISTIRLISEASRYGNWREFLHVFTTEASRPHHFTQIEEGAGLIMKEMVGIANEIRQLLGEVATTTYEQSKGVSEVVKAIHQLDSHTQQSAALVKEASSAAGSLGEIATKLTGEIACFVVAQLDASKSSLLSPIWRSN
jgi:methyl-accepting chemotaxis protein